jgi:hypothetical protein
VCAAAAGPGGGRGCREREYRVGCAHGSSWALCGVCVKVTGCVFEDVAVAGGYR